MGLVKLRRETVLWLGLAATLGCGSTGAPATVDSGSDAPTSGSGGGGVTPGSGGSGEGSGGASGTGGGNVPGTGGTIIPPDDGGPTNPPDGGPTGRPTCNGTPGTGAVSPTFMAWKAAMNTHPNIPNVGWAGYKDGEEPGTFADWTTYDVT